MRTKIRTAIFLWATVVALRPACGQGQRPVEGNLKVGDPAPDFALKYENLEKKGVVKLSAFKDKQPVVLVFGSYT